MPDDTKKFTVADYIIERLVEMGGRHVFNVPGNYSAQFLSRAQASGRLVCVGTSNEMEAGYAADAQARLRGIGVVCVTYGVGSFSVLNAIAGSYVERCPVVLLNGTANALKARQLVEEGVLFAHAIDGVRTDEVVFRAVTAATAVITSPSDAPAQIDRTLLACAREKRPVYIEVADGMWLQECPAPAGPLKPPAPGQLEDDDVEKSVGAAVEDVLAQLRQAERPVLWGGEELQRFKVQDLFEDLVNTLRIPYTTTLLGKAIISEDNPYFIGVYDSKFAPADTAKVVEGTDCLIALGTIMTDFYGPIVAKEFDRMILAAGNGVRIGRGVYPNVPIDRFMRRLTDGVKAARQTGDGSAESETRHVPPAGFEDAQRIHKNSRIKQAMASVRAQEGLASGESLPSAEITWESFFASMRDFLRDDMYVLADTSLCLFPASDLLIKKADHFVAQAAWLSIGYTVGAIVGVALQAGPQERAVAFVGDGGFRMIPMAVSTLTQQKRNDIIFVLDNGIYGIEQFLIDATYFGSDKAEPLFFNQLPKWDYKKLGEAFGAAAFAVTTENELEATLAQIAELRDVPSLVAVRIEPHSLPAELRPPPIVSGMRPTAAGEGRAISSAAFD